VVAVIATSVAVIATLVLDLYLHQHGTDPGEHAGRRSSDNA